MIPTSHPTPQSQTYRDQLHPWCIIRLLPKAQRITVARFRKRNDADDHTRTLRRLIPDATFIVIFAPPPAAENNTKSEASPQRYNHPRRPNKPDGNLEAFLTERGCELPLKRGLPRSPSTTCSDRSDISINHDDIAVQMFKEGY